MAGHLYLNCKRNGETFALICYYGRGETAFALNQTKSLIDYILKMIIDIMLFVLLKRTVEHSQVEIIIEITRKNFFPIGFFIEVLVIMA